MYFYIVFHFYITFYIVETNIYDVYYILIKEQHIYYNHLFFLTILLSTFPSRIIYRQSYESSPMIESLVNRFTLSRTIMLFVKIEKSGCFNWR